MQRFQQILARSVAVIACLVLLLLCTTPLLRDVAALSTQFAGYIEHSAPHLLESNVADSSALDSGGADSVSSDGTHSIPAVESNTLESLANLLDIAFTNILQWSFITCYTILHELDSYAMYELSKMIAYNYDQISQATYDTLYMVVLSALIATIFGLPLGIILSVTKSGRICQQPTINALLASVINIVRSFPFIILIILLLPLSRFIVGTSIGASAAVIPLSIAAIPFIARLFEGAFEEIDKGLIEATLSMGASKLRIMAMMIAEAKPGLLNAITITIIGLIGYSAMGGAVGAGGLGDVAIRLGFQAYQEDILISTSIVIILLVQFVQSLGDALVAKARKMR